MADGLFVRVYHEDLIANYTEIWDDDRALATWLRLLVIADKLWPSPAELPRGISRASLDKLVSAGLVQLVKPYRFRLRGLDAQRQRQRDSAKAAADARWGNNDAGGNAPRIADAPANGNPKAMPHADRGARTQSASASVVASDSEESGNLRASGPITVPVKGIDGKSNDVDVTSPVPIDTVRLQRLAEELTQQPHAMGNVYAGLGQKAVNEQLRNHGFDRVERAWRSVANRVKAEGASFPTLRQLVFGADEILNPVRKPDVREQREDEERSAFDRRVERTQRELSKLRGEESPA